MRPSNWNGLEPWGFFGGAWASEVRAEREGQSPSPLAESPPGAPPRKAPRFYKDINGGLWCIVDRTDQASFVRLSSKFAGVWTTYLAIFCREPDSAPDTLPDLHLFVDKSAIPFPYLQDRKRWPLQGLRPAKVPLGLKGWLRKSLEDTPTGIYLSVKALGLTTFEEEQKNG